MADRRFIDDDGQVWDSRYEYEVFEQFRLLGADCRRCSGEEGDSIAYTSKVRRGLCLDCQGTDVVQSRTYTPDVFVDAIPGPFGRLGPCIIESKGYWPAPKRNLLRRVYKARPDAPVILVFQKDRWVTRGKTSYTDYARRYFPNWGCMIWDNTPRLLPGQKRGGKKGVPPIDVAYILDFLENREQ